MKKIIKKVKVEKEIEEVSVPMAMIKPQIGKLAVSFPNEDLNKLVEKINEIIEKQNGN